MLQFLAYGFNFAELLKSFGSWLLKERNSEKQFRQEINSVELVTKEKNREKQRKTVCS